MKSIGISGELYNLLENYLSSRLQRVILNGQTSSWRPILAGVPQASILSALLFLFYINDLPNELKYNAKLFADDTSFFTIVKDENESANVLNNDLSLISKWVFNWKMLFNQDPTKPAQKGLLSRKKKTQNHLTLSLNAIQGFSREIPYQELGLESLKSRRWYKCLCCMYENNEKKSTFLIPKSHQSLRTKTNRIPTFYFRTACFKNSFFPSALSDWFQLDVTIRNPE